jgi:hypothetical protein
MTKSDLNWPKTLDEAAERFIEIMGDENKTLFRGIRRDQVIGFNQGIWFWGMSIRNAFGLWRGNQALRDSCGSRDADECSYRILVRVWEKLQDGE